MPWESVIGLEVHARLLTRTKMFCRCEVEFGAPPNSRTCPICLGYPGALPVANRQAVHLALKMAAATNCTIHPESIFARKNYFYPDLPKGYQITQYDRPLATDGAIEIRTREGKKRIRIKRIHLEEDAGKLMHAGDVSLVDLNRAGVPLIEIVSEPDIASSAEANAYLTRLRQILVYSDVCNGNMDEGSLRCDGNISVRRSTEPLGTRVEVKNLNSFRFLGRAIDFEIERQIAVLENGGTVSQETRLFDVAANETRVMRSKEEAHDYRYFDEPDLLPLHVDEAWIGSARSELPSLPDERLKHYEETLGIPYADAEVLVTTRELADYYEAVAAKSGNPKAAANWVRNEVLRVVNDRKIELNDYTVTPARLARLIVMIDSGAIGGKAAKEVFEEMSVNGGTPDEIVEKLGLSQVSDPAVIREAAARIIAAHPDQVAKYRSGKQQLFGFFVGQLMKEMRGKANAEMANQAIRALLD